MPADEVLVSIVRGWMTKADNDLKNAAHTLKLGGECPTDTVGFHAQQCVEKYLKAVLTFNEIPFPRSHDIEQLVCLLPSGLLADWPIVEQRTLTPYAAITRYPGEYEPITLAEARRAVTIARRVRRELRGVLPTPERRVRKTPRKPKR